MKLPRILLAISLTVFVACAVILLATVPRLYLLATSRGRAAEDAIADVCAETLSHSNDEVTFATRVLELKRRYPAVTIEPLAAGSMMVMPSDDETSGAEHVEVRPSGQRAIKIRFGRSGAPRVAGLIRTTATVGTAAGMIAFALALVTLLRFGGMAGRSREGVPDDASAYLFKTFETSIKTMKGRENELRRLHDQAQERANELANLTATLVRSLTSGFIAFDESGAVVDMNQAARDLIGTAPGAQPQGARQLVDLVGNTPFVSTLDKAVGDRASLQRVEAIHTRGDNELLIGLSTVALIDPRNRYLGMLALFTDLTPVRSLETRMREIQSLADLGEMSSGIAHEFRNSLSTVLGYLRLAKKSALPPDALDRIDRAEEEANELSKAVESLLVFARPVALHKQQIDVMALTTEIAERLVKLEPEIRLLSEGDPILIDADPSLLSRTIENIVRNAIEAIKQAGQSDGTITIRSERRKVPTLTISDTGVGMSDTDAAKAFVPFHSTKPGGFGLGLAIARKMMVLHGGAIRIVSAQSKGATFILEFGAA